MQIQLTADSQPQPFEVLKENEESETHQIQLTANGEVLTIPFIYDNNSFPKIFA